MYILFEQCKQLYTGYKSRDLMLNDRLQIDYITAIYGVHRLNGIVTPANAVYSAAELEHHIRSSSSQLVITCTELLPMPEDNSSKKQPYITLEDLILRGEQLSPLQALRWSKGQGSRQTAFLCYSSGTSGLPVGLSALEKNKTNQACRKG